MATSAPSHHLLVLALVTLTGCSQPAADPGASTADGGSETGSAQKLGRPDFVDGELLVKFRRGQPRASVQGALRSAGATTIKQFPRIGVTHVRVTGDVFERAAELSKEPSVEYAEPNYIVHAIETVPNDPSLSGLWGLNNTGQTGGTADADIDAPEAWDVQTGNGQVIIGVIDTGVDIDHVDLVDNLYVNAAEANGVAGVDDDDNGYVDDIHGINVITGTGNPNDDNGHGTHVSGTIGATSDNAIGVVGVNWDVQIAGCKFLSAGGSGSIDDAIECVEYFTALGVKATSNSWGGGGFSQAMKDAIDAADNAGILFIAAAGNDYLSNNDTFPHYPSNYDSANVISVASTDHNDNLSEFSNIGPITVDVAAPGTDIQSTWNDGDYNTISGTSMATPHVSGLAALLWSQFPDATSDEIKARIMLTVDPLGLQIASGGRINAHRALTADLTGPFLLSYAPRSGGTGEVLTLGGLNFGEAQGSGSVRVAGPSGEATECPVSTWTDTEIVCTVPALDDGAYDVAVTTAEGETTPTVVFTVIQPLYSEQLVEPQFIGGGVAQGWNADDLCWSYALPFTFNYYEVDYTSVWVCSNGFIDFSSNTASYGNGDAGLISRTMVAPLWDDLVTDGDIYIHQPSSTSVVFRWDARRFGGSLLVNIELVLDGADGSIRFNYGSGNTGLTPTVGISEGNGLRYHLAPHNNAASLTEAQSVIYTRGPGLALGGTNLKQVTCASNALDDVTVTVNASGGYEGTALLSLVNLPDGFSGSLTDELLTPPGQTTAQVSVGAVASGNYQFGVQALGTDIPDRILGVAVQVVDAVPSATELTSPADEQGSVSTAPTFTWSNEPAVDTYVIEVAEDASFETVIYTATVEGTSHRATVALPRLTTLYWRVRSTNVCGAGADSVVRSFTTTNEICLAPGVTIPDGSSAGINDSVVMTEVGLIADLDVRLGVSIGYVGDVAFTLTHEDTGTSVVFYDRPGVPDSTYGCGGTNIDATFDDASETPVETECGGTVPSIQGVLKPHNPLAAFNDEALAGTWTINARDLAGGYQGTLDHWCLSVVTSICGDGFTQTGAEECDDGDANSNVLPDACRTSCLLAYCGDGVNDTPEQCDDGADNSDTEPNACRTACLIASCGDGVTDSSETCDNGDNNSDSAPDACRTTCEPASCGDAVTDSGEQCDDGDANSNTEPDACRLACVAPSCGDSVTDSVEQCDNGDANSDSAPDACRTTCALAACGDGVADTEEDCDASGESELCNLDCTEAACGDETVNETAGEACDDGQETADCDIDCTEVECGDETVNVSAGEACDDGNDDDTDECLAICISSTCGDGFVQTEVEECDDGDNNSDELADACRENCMPAWCGDGVVDTAEGCDDGADNSDSEPNACRTDCFAAYCGDGVVDSGETCDDGADNSDSGADACRTTCLSASCGDGVLDEGEQCDDGASNGDGETCSSICELEVGGGRCSVQWVSPGSSTPGTALGAMIAVLGLALRRRRRH